MKNDVRYPIGKFEYKPLGVEQKADAIRAISEFPVQLRIALAGMTNAQLNSPYREGGWTVNQLINHIADSHMNSFIRFKLAMTEDKPSIKTYDEAKWAELPDANNEASELSMRIIDALHERWFLLLASMDEADFQRKLIHPDHGEIDLNYLLSLYEWHGRHHAAHIAKFKESIKNDTDLDNI